jgi:hypothetical protein
VAGAFSEETFVGDTFGDEFILVCKYVSILWKFAAIVDKFGVENFSKINSTSDLYLYTSITLSYCFISYCRCNSIILYLSCLSPNFHTHNSG